MFFPSRKGDSNGATTSPAKGGGSSVSKDFRNGKTVTSQKPVTQKAAPSTMAVNKSYVNADASPLGSLNAILSARPSGDDNLPAADSEQLVARLFKGIGAPMYQPRIPIKYKTEPIPPSLKDYRWKAFDLTISHDTMLTIAKPPPPPSTVPVIQSPSTPPIDEINDEPRLFITDVSTSELEASAEIELATATVPQSMKIDRLASQKMRSSAKIPNFNKKASAKLLTEFSDWKEARSMKNANVQHSIKMPSSSTLTTKPEESAESEEAQVNSLEETTAAPVVPNILLDDVESEQLIDGLLDLSSIASDPRPAPATPSEDMINPSASSAAPEFSTFPGLVTENAVSSEAKASNTTITNEPAADSVSALSSKLASVKINPTAQPPPSYKSVKSPNSSFFSSLISSISSKVASFGGDGKESDEEVISVVKPNVSDKNTANVDFSVLGIDKEAATSTENDAVGEIRAILSRNKTENATSKEASASEPRFDFYAEAAQLAADALGNSSAEESTARAQVAWQSDIRAPPPVSYSPETANKGTAKPGTIISPAERSVFKPTFAMPRPVQQERDPIVAELVRNLQGEKKFNIQTEPQGVEGPAAPVSGPKSKKKRDKFSVLEDLFLDKQPSPIPLAGKHAADLVSSDSEGEIHSAQKAVKGKKGKKPQQQKKLSPAKPQQWYLAGAYSSHHEAIDAINRLHKLLTGAATDPANPNLDLDNKFRLQRDLSRMQWVVECCDAQHKALVLSHAARSPVIPEKDKNKFRNIIGAIKDDDTPTHQGAGAGIYHSPPQPQHPNIHAHQNGSDHKRHAAALGHPHEEHFLRERDAFFENNMRMVKANLSPDESPPPRQAARRQPPHKKQNDQQPPQRGTGASVEKKGENGTRFPPIPQAQVQKQKQTQKKGKDT